MSKPTYECSDGTRLTKVQVNYLVTAAKADFLEDFRDKYDFHYCEGCKRSTGVRLTCSHIVSVDQCQKAGRTEVAFSKYDLELLCSERCHPKAELLSESEKWIKYENKTLK